MDRQKLIQYINLKLSILRAPGFIDGHDSDFGDLTRSLLYNLQEKNRLLADYLCPADQRVQDFIDDYLKDCDDGRRIRVPRQTFILDHAGIARELSLPVDADRFESEIVKSYRVKQGVLHNPRHDRRTTKGVFHVCEGGLPIPDDKKAVPKNVFANLLREAFNPPADLMRLPFTSTQTHQAELFVSLYLRPIVSPDVPGLYPCQTMETRFFVPGNLVKNLDFVESIFGNAGDPALPENDAALDVDHWTGHTGFVILAPHLSELTKKALGLPHVDNADERQVRDGMCWQDEDEQYNDGAAFKITCRDKRGVIVTVIADNYFGYCKKEVKTQISYSANLFGLCEEEHAGGAMAYASYDLGDEFSVPTHIPMVNHKFSDVLRLFGALMDIQPEGFGVDKIDPSIIYVPENVKIDLYKQKLDWTHDGQAQQIRLLTGKTYMLPSGYKVEMRKGTSGSRWRLIGTTAEGTSCHKPCTVSGGGKSEISKSIADAFIHGPAFTLDIQNDFQMVEEILSKDFKTRFDPKLNRKPRGRPILSRERSIGSVIKLLTPSRLYSQDYNNWLESMPRYVKELVFILKQYYRHEWGKDWQKYFSVDFINGRPGNELKYNNKRLISRYLRIGFTEDGSWRIYGLRRDFHPAEKLQTEDDISASITVASDRLAHLNANYSQPSVKFVVNCERRLFQRPDDAIHPGYDKQTENDLAQPGNFLSNFQPLTRAEARELTEDIIGFDQYTRPMQEMIADFVKSNAPDYVVCSSKPRLIDGRPSKNPRYLQTRPDLVDARPWRLAEIGTRLHRRIPLDQPVLTPVNAVLPGRRNNPPDLPNNIRPLAVFNPIHYMELPELFMEYICSMTGKSPSTTGAGSEGGLTKGPFNALLPITDLNNALCSYILTGYHSFLTAAGFVGPKGRVDHDVSLLMPEIWCRMQVYEREPKYLIEHGYLEKCEDFSHNGRNVPASLLGHRITSEFVVIFFGRILNNPGKVFSEDMLKPELQDMDIFVDGMDNIVTTHQRVSAMYFRDGSYELACPPLQALLHIMKDGEYEGKRIDHPDIRRLFTREYLKESAWYHERLLAKQKWDCALWEKHVRYLEQFLSKSGHVEEAHRLGIPEQLTKALAKLELVKSKEYIDTLRGTIGTDIM